MWGCLISAPGQHCAVHTRFLFAINKNYFSIFLKGCRTSTTSIQTALRSLWSSAVISFLQRRLSPVSGWQTERLWCPTWSRWGTSPLTFDCFTALVSALSACNETSRSSNFNSAVRMCRTAIGECCIQNQMGQKGASILMDTGKIDKLVHHGTSR